MITIGKKEVREFFEANPNKKFSQEDLSRILSMSAPAVSVAVKDMQVEGRLLVEEVVGRKGTKHKSKIYRLNVGDPVMAEVIADVYKNRQAFSELKYWPLEAVIAAIDLAESRKQRRKEDGRETKL